MAEDETITNPASVPPSSAEDDETRATRRELRQHTISDEPSSALRPETPADEAGQDSLKEQVSSPKKKRAHDQLDSEEVGGKATEEEEREEDVEGSVSSEGSGKDRASRLEPEKKRHRDGEADSSTDSSSGNAQPQPQTSNNAFAASGFGKIATATSPFASLGGAAASGSAFGSAAGPKLSSFASKPALAPAQSAAVLSPPVTLSFGATKEGASPFGGLGSSTSASKLNGFGSGGGKSATSVFGSATLGTGLKPFSGFGSSLGGAKPLGGEKPAKPFGAPDSDVESEKDEDDERQQDEDDEDDEPADSEEGQTNNNKKLERRGRSQSPEKDSDDKKKLKLQKVEVDDGEAGEATISSVRAKLFYMDKEQGWRERGAGMLKINVPSSCVDYDDAGHAIPGSFDASSLEDEDDNNGGDDLEAGSGAKGSGQNSRVVRLLMRQDQTHRILLNTVVVPAMKFQEKASLKSVGVLFTAFEGEEGKPVSVTLRMSAANAKTFLNDIELVQRELRGI